MLILGAQGKKANPIVGDLTASFGNADKSLDPGLISSAEKLMKAFEGKDLQGIAEGLMDFIDQYETAIEKVGGVDADSEDSP